MDSEIDWGEFAEALANVVNGLANALNSFGKSAYRASLSLNAFMRQDMQVIDNEPYRKESRKTLRFEQFYCAKNADVNFN